MELQPRQTYLNVDKDATAALETKRNFIYCLIVNILKQEKEMHIDNLVFKVAPPPPVSYPACAQKASLTTPPHGAAGSPFVPQTRSGPVSRFHSRSGWLQLQHG